MFFVLFGMVGLGIGLLAILCWTAAHLLFGLSAPTPEETQGLLLGSVALSEMIALGLLAFIFVSE